MTVQHTIAVMRLIASLLVLFCCVCSAADIGTQANLLVKENGASVVAFSSEFSGWNAEFMVPSAQRMKEENLSLLDFIWCTADNAAFPHWIEFQFEQEQWITALSFNNVLVDEGLYPGISAKNVEVFASSNESREFDKIAEIELQKNTPEQLIKFAPFKAKALKFVITSNWGHPVWTELNATGVYDDGSRPVDFAQNLTAGHSIDLYGIYFDSSSAILRSGSEATLQQILNVHLSHPDWKLIIAGHTDDVGSDLFNQILSGKRAEAVVDALVKMGADKQAFDAQGLGESSPVADNSSAQGRAKNRRVTIQISQ